MSRRLGVMLMTYGSPADDLHDLPEYLSAVRGGRPVSNDVVEEFRRRYRLIGGSPLVTITRAQAAALEEHLLRAGLDARCVAGMRFSEPSIAAGVARLQALGCDPIVGIVMSPQHSDMLMGGYRRALEATVEAQSASPPSVILAPAWYHDERFIDAVAARIRECLDRLPPGTAVLLTAHSLPRRVADAEPGYLAELRETAELVARAAGIPADGWWFCWQSAGHEPGAWMTPDFADLMPRLREAGHRSVLVAPIQFLADHLEVLYDIDVGARQQAEAAGMGFTRIESLNVMPQFVEALASVALEAASARAMLP
jgi:ferrochelatase